MENRPIARPCEKTRAKRSKFVDEIDEKNIRDGHGDCSSDRKQFVMVWLRNMLVETISNDFCNVDVNLRKVSTNFRIELLHRFVEMRNDIRPSIERMPVEIDGECRDI